MNIKDLTAELSGLASNAHLWRWTDAELEAKIKAVIEREQPNLDLHQALDVLRNAMIADPMYAWAWQSNVAVTAMDQGLPHDKANRAAASFMRTVFYIDTTNNPNFAATQKPTAPTASDSNWLGG